MLSKIISILAIGSVVSMTACVADQGSEETAVSTETVETSEDALQMCGGIANIACPSGKKCIDDPTDTCDPKNGGADCSGICVGKKAYVCSKLHNPNSYISQDPSQCALIKYKCTADTEPFSDFCGCGCE